MNWFAIKRSFFCFVSYAVVLNLNSIAYSTGAEKRPNVLFIVMDDMRPELGCYGESHVVSPNIDRLAESGMVFNRAYCQQSICNASRASVMTGLRPDSTGVYDLTTHFREKVPDVVTLPQHFKEHGYHTQALGKIYHPAFPSHAIGSDLGDPQSWSVPIWMGGPRYYYSPLGEKLTREVYRKKTGKSGDALEGWKADFLRSLATEAPDVPDSMLYDGELTDRSLTTLRHLASQTTEGSKPFFLSVGYLKPHLPYIAPKKYWDLYDPSKIELKGHRNIPKDSPEPATSVVLDELRASYPWDVRVRASDGKPAGKWETYEMPESGPLLPEQEKRLLHGYYACVSFVDAQIGRLLDELDRLNLADDTIVVLWGDHGYHLGEQSLWSKFTNFEVGTRSPLIVRSPHSKKAGFKTDALVEFVDVYPSLCELAGLELPDHLEGDSFVPVLEDPKVSWKTAAFSQYPRGGVMGRSIRTDTHRFTIWPSGNEADKEVEMELYDYRVDSGETVNVAYEAKNASLVALLSKRIEQGWKAESAGE